MSELGQQLKEARLQKGLSLDDVQEMTKIRKRYLEAIETGDYKVLPGSFYVRAFIKTYAETVGLNPDEILEGHKSNVPEPEPEAVMEPVTQKRSSRPASIGNLKWLPTALMWLFLVLIVGVIYAYWVSNNHTAPKTAENTTPITTPITPAPDSTNKGTTTPPQNTTTTPPQGSGQTTTPNNGQTAAPNGGGGQTTPDTGQTGQTQPGGTGTGTDTTTPDSSQQPNTTTPQQGVTVAQDGKQGKTTIFKVSSATGATVKVDIKATGESWLEVYKGQNSRGEKLSYGMTKSGDAMSFDIGPEGLYIKSGRSSATDISVAGQPITDNKSTTRVLIQPGEASSTGTSAGVSGTTMDSTTGSTSSTQSGTTSSTTGGE
ncbi:XRE family transcriptional regulator [Paenibacillus sp. IHB B 3084]|uniref:helix-turn-helix domain-containing protein n=1 Tax=unclassified Paenibacillus TaxID=185978 RepID=UPI00072184B0|nr:RodZ domain-containing protein [Paenibacillus sp. IHB B 3084]ALP34969.1 XRE family transcriptional regulator [Paenibacillus sp. IHB B 3084]